MDKRYTDHRFLNPSYSWSWSARDFFLGPSTRKRGRKCDPNANVQVRMYPSTNVVQLSSFLMSMNLTSHGQSKICSLCIQISEIYYLIYAYLSTEKFHWGGGKPKIFEGGCGQGEKKFSRGGNRAGRKFFWLHFSKIFWRGICIGNYKKNSGGGCGRGNRKYRREIWILISEIGDVGREVRGDVGRELAK